MSVREALRREPVAWAVVAGVVFLHVGFSIAGPYGFFRDELYFIDCGRHPAFGYVDQPPLVPWIAAATQLFGRCLALIRLLPALGHAATIVVTAALAGVVAEAVDDGPTESKRVAQLAAGGAVALAPMYWGLHSVLSTTAFETLAWTFIAYAMARATLRGETRWLVWLGVALGVALEAKYAAPFFVAPLVVGVLLGPSRRVLASRDAMIGLGAAVAIALPSFVWQATHRFPFLELMHAASAGKNTVVAPLPFLGNQAMVMNPVLAPMWIGGVAWALVSKPFVRVRFLAIAFLGVLLAMIAMHGKDYYVAPGYGVAFALGGVAVARAIRSRVARGAYFALASALMLIGLPTSSPVLPPATLARFVAWSHTQPQAQENGVRGALLPQLMADMLGWKELESQVADVWRSLTPEQRARTVIATSNYGEAGALNLYGPDDGLPRAVSGHNSYYEWGPGGDDALVMLRVNGSVARWQDGCDELTVPAHFGGEYAVPYERDAPILKCVGLRRPLREHWEDFKHYE